MRLLRIAVAVLCLAFIVAPAAMAQGRQVQIESRILETQDNFNQSIGVGLFNGSETALTPAPSVFPFSVAILGIMAMFNSPLGGGPWAWDLMGGFGIGRDKDESGSNEFEQNAQSYFLRAGIARWMALSAMLMYCGTGFQFASTTATFKATGSPDADGEAFLTYGISNRIGSAVPIGGGGAFLFGEVHHFAGFGSGEDGTVRVSRTVSSVGFRGGLLFGLGGGLVQPE